MTHEEFLAELVARGIEDACDVCGAHSWLNPRDRDAHVNACHQIEEGLKHDAAVTALEDEISSLERAMTEQSGAETNAG